MLFIISMVSLSVSMSFLMSLFLAIMLIIACYKIKVSGKDFYLTLLLSFVFPGAGLFYIGSAIRCLVWYSIQVTSFAVVLLLSHYGIQSKYMGLIIIGPFIIQLIDTCSEYKGRYGDIKRL